MIGAVKAVLGVTGVTALAKAEEVQPAGITAVAGAVLVLASAIA